MLNTRLQANLGTPARDLPVLAQSAALCHRVVGGRPEVLLITTRRSRSWVIPKGWLIDGLTASETAAQEAWEEAGVLGVCSKRPVGQFSYIKNRPAKGAAYCVVDVYSLKVHELLSHFPEAGERQLRWYGPQKAACRVRSAELAAVLRDFKVNSI